MTTVTAAAKVAFTHYVPGYGQVHGDPKGSKQAKKPTVPESVVGLLIERGFITKPKGWKAPVVSENDPADNPNARDAQTDEVEALKEKLAAAEAITAEAVKERDEAVSALDEATTPNEEAP